jgi:hypothetical protein
MCLACTNGLKTCGGTRRQGLWFSRENSGPRCICGKMSSCCTVDRYWVFTLESDTQSWATPKQQADGLQFRTVVFKTDGRETVVTGNRLGVKIVKPRGQFFPAQIFPLTETHRSHWAPTILPLNYIARTQHIYIIYIHVLWTQHGGHVMVDISKRVVYFRALKDPPLCQFKRDGNRWDLKEAGRLPKELADDRRNRAWFPSPAFLEPSLDEGAASGTQ